MPFGRFTYSPLPDSWTALPISPGTRGPVAPELVMWVIVRVSAAGPVPIWTCWPGARPDVLLRLRVVSPAAAGAASPELDRPSREKPWPASFAPAGTVTAEKTGCCAGCSVRLQPDRSTAASPALYSSTNPLVGLVLVPERNSLT